jgi:MFS transporter, DHA1 family, inner membrane transport protein
MSRAATTPARDSRATRANTARYPTCAGCAAWAPSASTRLSPILAATAGLHGTLVSVLLFGYGIWRSAPCSAGASPTGWGSRSPLPAVVAGLIVVPALFPVAATTAVVAASCSSRGEWAHGRSTRRPNTGSSNWRRALRELLLSLNASAIYLGVGLWGGWGADDRRPDDAAALVSVAGLLAVALGWRLRAQPSGASTSQSEPGKINPSCPSANLTK